MKKFGKLYIAVVLLFVVLFIASNLVFSRIVKKNNDVSGVMMNRMLTDIEAQLEEDENGVYPTDYIQKSIDRYVLENRGRYIDEYGIKYLPERVYYIPTEEGDSAVSLINKDGSADKIWALNKNGHIIGFVVFEFSEKSYDSIRILINICVLVSMLITLLICIYVGKVVLSPFERLSEYPLRLSKNQLSDKLPESKNRIFGKFIWGINMLGDSLENDRKRINELSRDHMTMVTTIAHGIKTPVSNIKLYSDAIRRGLYQPDKKANENDALIAEKISRNADEVDSLVKELIEKASRTVVDFKPEIKTFYISELVDFLKDEYGNRLNLLSIPFKVEMNNNVLLASDKDGVCRILTQLMENAIKYGNGKGISVNLSKEEDGFYFIVKNKGNVLDDNEIPYIFNSFWRGSNADGIGGSGIGLFESREIAKGLNGDIFVKSDIDNMEMEFDVYLPL
ncbi:MAG: HAMP domain-containing histidine kinase [Eubacterium sp.]|nr:HAMP domain-containing histidine kinase [Eubacterium sp.]